MQQGLKNINRCWALLFPSLSLLSGRIIFDDLSLSALGHNLHKDQLLCVMLDPPTVSIHQTWSLFTKYLCCCWKRSVGLCSRSVAAYLVRPVALIRHPTQHCATKYFYNNQQLLLLLLLLSTPPNTITSTKQCTPPTPSTTHPISSTSILLYETYTF